MSSYPQIDDEHHLALGLYVAHWGQLEHVADFILAEMLPGQSSAPITGMLSIRDKVELANNILADPFLAPTCCKQELGKFFDVFRRASFKRNRIIHATWRLVEQKPCRVAASLTEWSLLNIISKPIDRKKIADNIIDINAIRIQTDKVIRITKIGSSLLTQAIDRRLDQHSKLPK